MDQIDLLLAALADGHPSDIAAGIQVRQRLAPPYGQLTMPPVYGNGDLEIHPRLLDGQQVDVTELDSVGSSANRLEEVLLDAHRADHYGLPVSDTTITSGSQTFKITTLEAPHRIYDAWIRLSVLPGETQSFEDSEQGRELSLTGLQALDPILEASSHDLALGTWDSHRKGPSGQVRVARSFTSTVLGINPKPVYTRASRRDPLNIGDEKEIKEHEGKAPKGSRLSEQGLSSIPPQRRRPGVSIEEALFTGYLSFASLRRLRFARYDNTKARALLAALILYALALRVNTGWSLRSECELIPTSELEVTLLWPGKHVSEPIALSVDSAYQALTTLHEQLGLVDRSAHLEGGPRLTALVEKAIASSRAND
jgi:CRISPR-associated protein Csb1